MRLSEKHAWWVTVLAGLLPIVSVNLAFLINIGAGMEGCMPYWEGCMSVSKGVRTGPGLALFKIAALPSAIAMALCWMHTGGFLCGQKLASASKRRTIVWMGVTGAIFSLVYATWLGTEGEIYKWMRRYGVVFYFGMTGLAQLLLVSVLWKSRRALLNGRLFKQISLFAWTVMSAWALGVASAFKRKLIDDPAFLDRVENALEWDFAIVLSLAFVALGMVFRGAREGG